ncbi:MAG: hypothetical protein ACSW8J_03035 [bacterium]
MKMIMAHKSSSVEQMRAEEEIFEHLSNSTGISDLENNHDLPLGDDGIFIRPDIYSKSERIIGEIHAHIGRLKSSQLHKIAADLLKMLLYDKTSGITHHKWIIVCSKAEEKQLQGGSYLAEAIRQFDVEIIRVDIKAETCQALKDAQERQKMVNA